MDRGAVLTVEGISKSFGIVQALSKVSVEFLEGEIHGLIGENGSGKSTLSSVITGVYKADEGQMFLSGDPYAPSGILESGKKGVCMIMQEMGTIGGISVAANIFAGKEHLFAKAGIVDKKKMITEAQKVLDDIGASEIRAEGNIDRQSFENRKIVEIARAMYEDVRVLIIDETTTALSQKGRSLIYDLMERLKKEKKVVIFISHDLDELAQRCDRITVLRDGVMISTLEKQEISPDNMRRLMVGRDVNDAYYRTDYGPVEDKEDVLTVEGVCKGDVLKNISFSVKKGEILGIGGLTDCGMHEMGRVIFGIEKPDYGSIKCRNKRITSPAQSIREKIGYVSKNRDKESILSLSSIKDNICLPSYDKIRKSVYVSPVAERKLAQEESEKLRIKMSSIQQLCSQLSGGNKQKVALAKWLGNESEILILDCPTRGIDVGVKAAIYKLMAEYREEGRSILMISEELPELLGMSDRILILKDGEIAKEYKRDRELTETDVIQYMI